MSPVDECLQEDCFDAGCFNVRETTEEPLLVNTNQSSLVGVSTSLRAQCGCAAEEFDAFITEPKSCEDHYCLNNGTCVETWNDYK